MIELYGKYTNAKIYTDNIEPEAISQITKLINEPVSENTQIAIMPDVHAGKGTTIGTTIKLPNDQSLWRICPNIVGVDIGCAMSTIKIDKTDVNLEYLDQIVNKTIPAGFSIHDTYVCDEKLISKLLDKLSFKLSPTQKDHIIRSCGTLGGGNHFLELGKDNTNLLWLTVHSGSRNLGVLVAKHHQTIAESQLDFSREIHSEIILYLIKNHRQMDIQSELNKYKETGIIPKYIDFVKHQDTRYPELAYLDGELLNDYLNDMKIAQQYASISRSLMLSRISNAMNWNMLDSFESVHNYIDIENGIIRKGATSAQNGERLIIPLTMRDGSIFATGLGNNDWNYSAPHGAGRKMSRSKAKELISIDDYKHAMMGVYSSSVCESTLDESPFAYKDVNDIINNITNTVTINTIVKPLYNFKAK